MKKIKFSIITRNVEIALKSALKNFANICFGKTFALNNLDRQLESYFSGLKSGVYLEVGAADGVSQSNTLLFARKYKWKGILVEPILFNSVLCRIFRPSAVVERCILSSFEDRGKIISIGDGHLISQITSKGDKKFADQQAVVSATLSDVLDRNGISRLDLLSVDVEGAEVNLLQGIDHQRHKIEAILVETENLGHVTNLLSNTHSYHSQLSWHDYLFVRNAR